MTTCPKFSEIYKTNRIDIQWAQPGSGDRTEQDVEAGETVA